MDRHSRDQYLDTLREEYRAGSKKQKKRLLNEARKRTRLNRKVLIRKLAHPRKPKPGKRAPRTATYGAEVVTALVKVWEVLDYVCGQRLAPGLRKLVDGLRAAGELKCSEEVAGKLKRNPAAHPLLYQKIPVKVAADWDTSRIGNLQVDYVEHCGRSWGGEYVHTLSMVDIASGWWEGEAIASRRRQATQEGLDAIRKRAPFRFREIHPDNDRGMINDLLWRYCQRARIKMSRSRPYKKNDNAWVEQRNWTHVRKVVGYRRFDTQQELEVMQELYGHPRLYQNFFQPSMKLVSKERVGGKLSPTL